MDLERWKLFLLVAEMGSLSKAAVVLNRPQPVVSRHINALETECGCSLFYRTGRGVALTETGEAMLPRVRALVADSEHILLDFRKQAGVPVGRVSVGLLPSVRIATDLVRAVNERYPGIDLHLTEASGGLLAEQVATGRIDLALVLREPQSVNPSEEALLKLPICLAAPSGDPLATADEIALAEVAGLPLIMARPPNSLRLLVEQSARHAQVPLRFTTQVDPLGTQKLLVAAGLGYTITTRMAVRDEVARGELAAADIAVPQMTLLLVLVRSNQRPATLAIRKVAQLLSQLTRHLPERHSDDPRPAYLSVKPEGAQRR